MNSQFNMQGGFQAEDDDTFIVSDRRGRRRGAKAEDEKIQRGTGAFAEKVGSIIGPTYITSKQISRHSICWRLLIRRLVVQTSTQVTVNMEVVDQQLHQSNG